MFTIEDGNFLISLARSSIKSALKGETFQKSCLASHSKYRLKPSANGSKKASFIQNHLSTFHSINDQENTGTSLLSIPCNSSKL